MVAIIRCKMAVKTANRSKNREKLGRMVHQKGEIPPTLNSPIKVQRSISKAAKGKSRGIATRQQRQGVQASDLDRDDNCRAIYTVSRSLLELG